MPRRRKASCDDNPASKDRADEPVSKKTKKCGIGIKNKERLPKSEEVSHLLMFLMAQLRWQHGTLVGDFTDFDDECKRLDPENGCTDVVAMGSLMEVFFSRHAKGDKWVPFHAALGTHETYIFRRIWSLSYLSEGERYALSCAFSGSRFPALFDEAVMDPCFPEAASSPTPEGRRILDAPSTALARGSLVHKRFLAYRKRGGKLHTTAYSPRPVPAGASGDEYTFYILERTRTFLEMGKALYPRLEGLANGGVSSDVDAGAGGGLAVGWEAVDAALQETRWVGPTLAKMFLVSTHLCLPRLRLLDAGIEVGIGAQEAFKLLLPGIQPPKDYSMLPDRREVLCALHQHFVGGDGGGDKSGSGGGGVGGLGPVCGVVGAMEVQEPRLRPMIAWCAARARGKFCGGPFASSEQASSSSSNSGLASASGALAAEASFPPNCFDDSLSILTFQVNLCEWRKFRNNVDKDRVSKKGIRIVPTQQNK